MRRLLVVVALAAVVSGVAGLLVVGLTHQDTAGGPVDVAARGPAAEGGQPAPPLEGNALDGSGHST